MFFDNKGRARGHARAAQTLHRVRTITKDDGEPFGGTRKRLKIGQGRIAAVPAHGSRGHPETSRAGSGYGLEFSQGSPLGGLLGGPCYLLVLHHDRQSREVRSLNALWGQ